MDTGRMRKDMSINIKGYLMDLDVPKVMGILNITPDSFFQQSRTPSESLIRERVERMMEVGADIIDIGGCSTRPGYTPPGEAEEWERLNLGCRIVREAAPEVPISVDTFRHTVARRAIDKWGIEIVNDVSGCIDPYMGETVAHAGVAYVLTHNRADGNTDYNDVTADVITELSWKINELHRLGVNDVIVDPGFGFAKTVEQNFRLLDELDEVAAMGCPVLAGISRKSMIWRSLGCSPDEALAGTVALDAIALEKGASILRVHDVREAKETVRLFTKLKNIPV